MLQLAGILGLSVVLVAGAAGGQGRAPRDEAEELVKTVEAGPGHEVAREMIAHARAALARGNERRTAGDELGGKLADGLALAWANAARDAVRAAEAERRASEARAGAADAGARAERERALLEEGIAQTGRLRAQLEAVAREAHERPATTNQAAADAGAPKAVSRPAPRPAKPARDGGAS